MRREETVHFDAGRLRTGLEVIANQLGKQLDEDNPLLNAQLPDGSRLAAVIPPVVRPAPALTIRKFPSRHYTVDDLIARGTLTRPLAEFLAAADSQRKDSAHQRRNLNGKDHRLRVLANAIPEDQRIVVIEDTSELHIHKPNMLAVECQTDTFKASITFDDLLKSALRWRPDRIILGEVRGIEARTLLDSLNTGHAGSLATIHANSAEKALHRFANLVMRNHAQTTFIDTEAEIGEAVDFVVHVERQPGRRVIREVLALRGYDRDTKRFLMEPVFEVQHAALISRLPPTSSPVASLRMRRLRSYFAARIPIYTPAHHSVETCACASLPGLARARERTGANIYVAANPLRSGSRKRTKESIASVRHLYIDIDTDGEARLAALRASNDVPTPNSPLHLAR